MQTKNAKIDRFINNLSHHTVFKQYIKLFKLFIFTNNFCFLIIKGIFLENFNVGGDRFLMKSCYSPY